MTVPQSAETEESTRRDVPAAAESIRQFLNTLDIESGTDQWDSAEATRAWLGEHDLCSEACSDVSADDLVRLRAFREAVRDFVEFRETEIPDASRQLLATEMARCPLVLTFCGIDDRDVRLQPVGDQADAAIAWILALIRESQLAGYWNRLRICRADDCRWAFYDHSRNASSHWCSMAVCGNRAKARRHRARAVAAG